MQQNVFSENQLAIEMKKNQIYINTLAYLELTILELIMDTDSFIVYTKTDDLYRDIAEDIETRFDTSRFGTPLPKAKNKKVIGLMKDRLDGKIKKQFVGL